MKKIILLIAVSFSFSKITYSQPGYLDPAFGNNGIVTTNIGSRIEVSASGKQVLSQADGSMYILTESGEISFIKKTHADGSADVRYGLNGYSNQVNLRNARAAMQADGKIVVIGGVDGHRGSGTDFGVARYNTDGTLDNTFGEGGKQTTDFGGSEDTPFSIAIQNDGKIAVSGSVYMQGDYYSFLGIVQYGTDGRVDRVIRTMLLWDFNPVVIQDDGKILVGANIERLDSTGNYFNEFVLIGYNTDGSADTSFFQNELPAFYRTALALQSDGKIVIAGAGNNKELVVSRYNSDLNADSTFSDDGIQMVTLNTDYNAAGSIFIRGDGKIAVSVSRRVNESITETGIVRYNADGRLDNTLSGDGKLIYNPGSDSTYYTSTTVQSDGKIGITGYALKNAVSGIVVARYNADGTPDVTFDNDGQSIEHLRFTSTYYKGAAIQRDGKIVAGGYTLSNSNYDFALARYNTDGSLDNTFSGDGKQTTDFGSNNDYASSVAIQSDGKIVVAGYSYNAARPKHVAHFILSRYNTDGSLDHTFSDSGKLSAGFASYAYSGNYLIPPSSIALQNDGKLVVVGTAYDSNFTSSSFVARYNTNGSPDLTFKKQNIFAVATAVAIQPDGKIVLAGGAFQVARLNADGSIDSTFSEDGYQESFPGYEDDEHAVVYGAVAKAVAIQGDGKIVVAGSYVESHYYFDRQGFALARYNTDGSVDSSFSDDGQLTTPVYKSAATTVAIQNDGKIVVAGSSGSESFWYHPDPYFSLHRFNSDGSPDSSFSNDGVQITRASGANDYIEKVIISNNKLYAAGHGESLGDLGIVARYFLGDENKAPTVSLTVPYNIVKYTAPARIKLNAIAVDEDDKITKVHFYTGATRLHTQDLYPYGFLWTDVPAGHYTLTAKAFDNSGNATTSNSIEVSVVDENVPPVVSIVSPVDDTTYTGPATIEIIAKAIDPNDRIAKVELYNGTDLIRTEYIYPYRYTWTDVQPGTYTITAKAYDDKGLSATSEPVTVTVTNASIVSSRPSVNSKTDLNAALSLRLLPNPARSTLQIFTKGLQLNKPSTISVISASGVVMKTVKVNAANKVVQLDVSSLVSGVYTIKVITGDKVFYKQFMKL